jgi:hypothetical protein
MMICWTCRAGGLVSGFRTSLVLGGWATMSLSRFARAADGGENGWTD